MFLSLQEQISQCIANGAKRLPRHATNNNRCRRWSCQVSETDETRHLTYLGRDTEVTNEKQSVDENGRREMIAGN